MVDIHAPDADDPELQRTAATAAARAASKRPLMDPKKILGMVAEFMNYKGFELAPFDPTTIKKYDRRNDLHAMAELIDVAAQHRTRTLGIRDFKHLIAIGRLPGRSYFGLLSCQDEAFEAQAFNRELLNLEQFRGGVVFVLIEVSWLNEQSDRDRSELFDSILKIHLGVVVERNGQARVEFFDIPKGEANNEINLVYPKGISMGISLISTHIMCSLYGFKAQLSTISNAQRKSIINR